MPADTLELIDIAERLECRQATLGEIAVTCEFAKLDLDAACVRPSPDFPEQRHGRSQIDLAMRPLEAANAKGLREEWPLT